MSVDKMRDLVETSVQFEGPNYVFTYLSIYLSYEKKPHETW